MVAIYFCTLDPIVELFSCFVAAGVSHVMNERALWVSESSPEDTVCVLLSQRMETQTSGCRSYSGTPLCFCVSVLKTTKKNLAVCRSASIAQKAQDVQFFVLFVWTVPQRHRFRSTLNLRLSFSGVEVFLSVCLNCLKSHCSFDTTLKADEQNKRWNLSLPRLTTHLHPLFSIGIPH